MSNKTKKNVLVLFSILFFLQGCTHVISQRMRDEANMSLTFEHVQVAPDNYIGTTVIWGGLILDTENRPDSTCLTILQTPLDSWGEPREEYASHGRFLIKYPSYLDPEIYKKGRKVSVAGEIIGKEIRPIGDIPYTYPLILAKELHLWKEPQTYYSPPYYWFYWDYYWYPFGWGYRWRHRHYRHYRWW